jgi:hypothetical protein
VRLLMTGVLVWFLVQSAAARAADTNGRIVYEDAAHNITIHYMPTSDGRVRFSSTLPLGWTFQIDIDGDQNGIWGSGSEGSHSAYLTTDLIYAQETPDGVFCPAYVLTSKTEDPSQIYASSVCGSFHSMGHEELSAEDATGRATISFDMPADEIFAGKSTAHLQACVWDTKQETCQHTLPSLLIIPRE